VNLSADLTVGQPATARYSGFRLAIVGPLPPPSGGMANQCRQLARLLQADGIAAEIVRNNPPHRPAFVGSIRGVRAVFRLVPYLLQLWRVAGRVDVLHLFANSGWAWHLFAAPAIWIARLRGKAIIVNYRGGHADTFLAQSASRVLPTLRAASALVVPSAFLQGVFARYGVPSEIVPNIIDLDRFRPRVPVERGNPVILVARNLEPIYDIATALRAFAQVRAAIPGARLVVAGSGPERERLLALAGDLGVTAAVTFAGRVDNADMPALYHDADLALNSSTVDNMPISLLEAYACGVPVVSTNVGGVPFIADDGETALLVPARDADAMARALLRLLGDRALYLRMRSAALEYVGRFAWPRVREQWLACYARVAAKPVRAAA
jgi:glycosyltransferase involved in cell wall biosynthesis